LISNIGNLVHISDWVADATYRGIPLPKTDPDNGGFKLIKDPSVAAASPSGWHDDGIALFFLSFLFLPFNTVSHIFLNVFEFFL